MKSNAAPSLYFSAYPLKAITEPVKPAGNSATIQTPYLRSILAGKTKSASRVRVFPMANPYRLQANHAPVKKAKDVDTSADNWFHHYE